MPVITVKSIFFVSSATVKAGIAASIFTFGIDSAGPPEERSSVRSCNSNAAMMAGAMNESQRSTIFGSFIPGNSNKGTIRGMNVAAAIPAIRNISSLIGSNPAYQGTGCRSRDSSHECRPPSKPGKIQRDRYDASCQSGRYRAFVSA